MPGIAGCGCRHGPKISGWLPGRGRELGRAFAGYGLLHLVEKQPEELLKQRKLSHQPVVSRDSVQARTVALSEAYRMRYWNNVIVPAVHHVDQVGRGSRILFVTGHVESRRHQKQARRTQLRG